MATLPTSLVGAVAGATAAVGTLTVRKLVLARKERIARHNYFEQLDLEDSLRDETFSKRMTIWDRLHYMFS